MDLIPIGRSASQQEPGLNPRAYVALMREVDVAAFPADWAGGSIYENAVVLDPATPITFAVPLSDGFVEFQTTPNKGNSGIEGLGDPFNKSSENTVTVMYKGTEAEIRGFVELNKNEEFIILTQDKCGDNSEYDLIGLPCSPAYIDTYSEVSGAVAGDVREWTISFKSQGKMTKKYRAAVNIQP